MKEKYKIYRLLWLFFLGTTFFLGCSKRNNGNNRSELTRIDLSGNYKLKGIECYHSSILTNITTFSLPNLRKMIINGNSFSTILISESCTVETKGKIDFFKENEIGEKAIGIFNITDHTVSSASNGNCIIKTTLNGTTITPQTTNDTYVTGQSLPLLSEEEWMFNSVTKTLYILRDYEDAKGGTCLDAYVRE